MPKFRNEIDQAMKENNATFITYSDRLRLIATSLFTWKNLDKVAGFGANRFLENALYELGKGCFVKDPELGFLALKANDNGIRNVYNLPTKISAWGMNYNKQFDTEDIVFIGNNEQFLATKPTLDQFAWRLYQSERTIDVNLQALKTPVLIEGDTKSALTLKNVYQQYSGNTPFIFGNKAFDISNKLNVLKTDAPYLIDKLDNHKHEIWNEALTFLGINNANTQKRERLVTSEVESNDELISYYLNCFYKARKKAADEINEKFGLTGEDAIDIVINSDFIDEVRNGVEEVEDE